MKDDKGYELHSDGTRKGDTNLQRMYDRTTGWAGKNKARAHCQSIRDSLSKGKEERDVFKGKGSVFETDPFFNPWAKGGTFNP